ncbi:hypothetical protein [Acetobacter lambici]|uniref:Uncharacterized protein n=2 Tax=Acetobacter TaxID=434 RepID=A0ABT1F4E9_9PROT|nr:hypothetical protein [Acetobacter lambici]MCP1244070.1 hypothetical protein [Acetobacter lambici]MCP1260089.1 hypothetical protein [Acetobacter lambici]
MTETIANPGVTPIIIGSEIEATPFRFGFDLGAATVHTIIIGPTGQGMSCLAEMMSVAMDAKSPFGNSL